MKKFLTVAVASLLSVAAISAAAAQPGAYIGAGAGYGKVSNLESDYEAADIRNTAGVARLFAGYNFSKKLGVELGVAHTDKTKLDYKWFNDQRQMSSMADLVAKGYLPLTEKLDLIGFAGAAYVRSRLDMIDVAGKPRLTRNAVRPELGLGASYALTKNVSAIAEYTYVDGNNYIIGPMHFGTLSLAYNFG